MIRLVQVTPTGLSVDEVSPAEAATVNDRSGWAWIDAAEAADVDIVTLGEALGFDHVALTDVLSPSEFPKVDELSDHLFIVTHSVGLRDQRLATVELDVFLTTTLLVTFHREPVPGVDWTLEYIAKNPQVADAGPGWALAEILELGARRYLELITFLDDQITELESLAIAGHPEVVGRVQDLRRDAITLRRVLAPERNMIRTLSRADAHIDGRTRRRLEGVYDDYFRIVESLDAARAMLAAVLETYRSTVAERTNEVMRVLTVFSAIVLPLSLIAGVYGMNFANMPELDLRWGYLALLVVMASIGTGLWLYFARRGFIGGPKVPRLDRAIGRGLAGFVHLTTQPVRYIAGRRSPRQDREPADE